MRTFAHFFLTPIGILICFASIGRAAPGDLDTGFVPGDGIFDQNVYAVAIQPDGTTVVGGDFINAGSNAGINKIGRIKADGSLDTTFQAGNLGFVLAAVTQPDGKVIIAGGFVNAGGNAAIDRLARLDTDGTVDPTFLPGDGTIGGTVNGLALQPDGKVIAVGDFLNAGGDAAIDRVARFNTDGTLDTTFKPGDATFNSTVNTVAVQSDGNVLVGGNFLNAGGDTAIDRLARVNTLGTLDTTYKVGNDAFISSVVAVAIQADGKAIVTGDFTFVGGNLGIDRLARIDTDGTVDTSFVPGSGTLNNSVASAAIQADGKIIAAGTFVNAGGNAGIDGVARFKTDGMLDTTFVPGDGTFNVGPYAAALQANGEVVVSGNFLDAGGNLAIDRVARLENGSATGSLTVPNLTQVKWLRGGTAPEATRVIFEYSTDGGTTYNPLGDGVRISGGWRITGVNIPAKSKIRARAFTTGGYLNGSGGLVEAFATAPSAKVVPKDTWTAQYNLANYYYALYAAYGYYDYAAAFFYYYNGLGDYYYHLARKNQGPADFALYNGLGLYYLAIYNYSAAGYSNYYYYLALAYYYYYAGFGDFNNATLYYNAFVALAFG